MASYVRLALVSGNVVGNDGEAHNEYCQRGYYKPDHYSFSNCLKRLIAERFTQTPTNVTTTTAIKPDTIKTLGSSAASSRSALKSALATACFCECSSRHPWYRSLARNPATEKTNAIAVHFSHSRGGFSTSVLLRFPVVPSIGAHVLVATGALRHELFYHQRRLPGHGLQ